MESKMIKLNRAHKYPIKTTYKQRAAIDMQINIAREMFNLLNSVGILIDNYNLNEYSVK